MKLFCIFAPMNLISHIEFLLHTHNCVVVPDLGGFVVNVVPSYREGVSDFHAPKCELVFNRDLRHNDGLLAQSYMKTDALSFEAASRKIEQEVQELKKQLREKRYLDLGKLGMFTMHDDERFVYTPAEFVRPMFFGLQTASLKPLIQMPVPILPPKTETKKLRRFSARAAAVVAAGLLLFALPSNESTVNRQSAQLFYENTWSPRSSAEIDVVADAVPIYEATVFQQEVENNIKNVPAVEIIVERIPTYYIIIGVFQYAEGANITKNRLIANGISQAATMERNGRIYVTAASHNDRNVAQAALRRLHREHPAYFDAWVLRI